MWRVKLGKKREDVCGLVLHAKDECADHVTGNQSKALTLKLGSMRIERKGALNHEDKTGMSLHAKDLRDNSLSHLL